MPKNQFKMTAQVFTQNITLPRFFNRIASYFPTQNRHAWFYWMKLCRAARFQDRSQPLGSLELSTPEFGQYVQTTYVRKRQYSQAMRVRLYWFSQRPNSTICTSPAFYRYVSYVRWMNTLWPRTIKTEPSAWMCSTKETYWSVIYQ